MGYRSKQSEQIHRALLGLALCVASTSVSAQSLSNLTRPPADKIRPLEVTVNGAKAGDWVFVERDGVLYAPQAAFLEWRVRLQPTAQGIDVKGQKYFALSNVPGYESKIDFSTQSLALSFSPQSFESTLQQESVAGRAKTDPVLPSLFVNYDLSFAANSQAGGSTVRSLGALTELGYSSNAGVLTSRAVGRNLIKSSNDPEPPSWVRLETTFTRDFPDSNRTLRLGDSVTRGSLLGRNAYFGGVQYGSNFALTPGFISQPLPTISGLSSAPSTVELYINNVLRQTTNVPTGPFTLTNLPTLNGSGDARLVVRDLLGRETVVTQPFFNSPQLLAPGLADWSVEAGALRQNLGVTSASYGAGFVSGTYKQVITSDLTVETRAELTRNLQAGSLGAITVLSSQILGRAAYMTSRSATQGTGGQWLLGADYSTSVLTAGFEVQGASRGFRQLGVDTQTVPIRLQVAGSASYFKGNNSTFSAAFAVVDRFDVPRVSTLTLGYNMRVLSRGNLQISAGRSIAGVAVNSIGVTLLLPIGDNIITSAGVDRRGGQTNGYVSATSNSFEDNNLGWRVLAGQQSDISRAEAGLNYATRFAELNGELSKSGDQTALRLRASGALLAADGRVFVSQRINDAFALVEVPGYPNLNVSLGGRVLSRTDASGIAVVPRLLAYQANPIRLDANQLPISAEIDNIEQSAVPKSRSGIKLVFATRLGRAALLSIVLTDGEAAPAGATLHLENSSQDFYVARRGQAYVTGLLPANRVTMKWKGQQCTLNVVLPPLVQDDFARIGPLVCEGIQR
jgi:outer membrane usher protein